MTPPGRRPDIPSDAEPEGLTVAEAASRLGVTPDAVRRRLHRGTLAGAKTIEGEWRVWLPESAAGDEPGGRQDGRPDAVQDAARMRPETATTAAAAPPVDSAVIEAYEARLAELRADVTFLRAELETRSEEIRRRDHIIAGFIERMPALEANTSGDAPVVANQVPRRAEASPTAADATSPAASAWGRFWRALTGRA